MSRRSILFASLIFFSACATAPSPPPAAGPQGGAPAQAPDTTLPPPVHIARPLPPPVEYPVGFQRALENGTRSETGAPGPRYWQQSADYKINARIDTERRRLDGSAEIRYHNNSPHGLTVVWLQMIQNFHRQGSPRTETAEITGGFELSRVSAFGMRLSESNDSIAPGYRVDGTRMAIRLPRPLLPGETAALSLEWSFAIPKAGVSGRMGYDRDNLFHIAYWYPQMAVFDDVVGWQTDPFLGTAEFYQDYGNYDYTVDAPAGWVVMGTGELLNAAQTLAPPVLERMRAGAASDTVVHVITAADFGHATQPGTGGRLLWQFRATRVRDVAFSLTRESNWDVTRTPVGDPDHDGKTDYTRIGAFWRATAPRWHDAARFAAQAIAHHSEFTGLSYAYPHMTAVEGEGIIGGGMEYPMMTLIGSYTNASAGDSALYGVVAHELAHMWVPMMVGVDERRYGWLDEGTTTFNEEQAKKDFYPGVNWDLVDQEAYLATVRAGMEGEMMRRSDYHYNARAYVTASYDKPATVLAALRGLLGEEEFLKAYREVFQRWAFKHPYPWDVWNTFNHVSGRDLDWFWESWYYQTWTLDQAVAEVSTSPAGTRIVIQDRGMVPMPARLTITRADGSTVEREVPVETWLSGAREAVVSLPAGAVVTKVEIDPGQLFPDIDRTNNVWRAAS